MRIAKTITPAFILLLLSVAAVADDKKQADPVTWGTMMPAIQVANQPLGKVLDELKQKLPGFNLTISRANVPHDYPILPAITFENVTLEQFFQMVGEKFPGIVIGYGRDQDGAAICSVDIRPDPNIHPPVIQLFGLAEIIAYRAPQVKADGDHEKQATNDILSLIQAALDTAGNDPAPTLKIHPPTQTLIFKGTAAQAEIVTNALAVLQPVNNPHIFQAGLDAVNLENRQLKDELKKLRAAATQPSK